MYQQTYEEGVVVSFKLVNGDEIVSKVVSDNKDSWSIVNPVTIIPAREGGIHMVPSMMSAPLDATFDLPKRQVMLNSPSAEPVADSYREITTGIKAVRKPGIVLG